MKQTILLLATLCLCSGLFGQVNLDLVLTEDFQAKESSYDNSTYIGADENLFYSIVTKYVDKKDGYSRTGNIAFIVGYSIKTLETVFSSELILPANNAQELSFHGAFPNGDGLNIIYSFYDSKNNERVIALAKMDIEGTINSEVTKLSATARSMEYSSSQVTFHYQQDSETAVIVEKSPVKGAALVATTALDSEVHIIHVAKTGKVLFDRMVRIGEKKKYEFISVEATDDGSVFFRRDGKYEGTAVFIHGPSASVNTLDNPKDELGKDFLYTEPRALFQRPNGETVSLEILHSTVKKFSRTLGFRTTVFNRNGDLKTSFIHKIDVDDTYGAVPNPTKNNFLRGFQIEAISMDESTIHISGFCLGMLSLGNVNSITLGIDDGAYSEDRCERFFKPKGSYATSTGIAYGKEGKSGFIQKAPVDWMGKDCSELERITKKNGENRRQEFGYQTLSTNGSSQIEMINFNGADMRSKVIVREILDINGKHLGVLRNSGKTYFCWLPGL
ncbi:MAG: hypothetical protein AB8B53_14755 [Flavobacteriales bacterium]